METRPEEAGERAPGPGLFSRRSPGLAAAQTGAFFYALWALMHVWVAWQVWQLGLGQAGIVEARILQQGVYMGLVAIAALAVAVMLNWRNSVFGFWFNLILVSLADLVFLAVVVLPGHVPLGRGLIGPALWIAALVFSALGHLRARRGQGQG